MKIALAFVLVLGGCATMPPEKVVTDSICSTDVHRTWSVGDTPQTIQESVGWNNAIRQRCKKKAPTS